MNIRKKKILVICLANAIVTGGNFSTNCYHQIFNDGIYSLITLDGVTLSKSTNGYNVTKNATYADIEINNSNIANMNSYAIYNNANYGSIEINNTIISGINGIYDYYRCNININESNITTSGRAIYIYNRSNYSGMSFDIVNSTSDVTGNERVIYIERPNNNLNIKSSKLSNTNSSSNFEAIHMTGGSINILGDTVVKTGGAAIYSNTTYNITINIESGTLESKVWQAIEMPNTPGKITLGKKDGTINESPILKSSLTARTINANNMTLNFYDGKLIGAKNNIIGVTINELEENVDIISNMNEDGYEEITLGIPTEYVAEIVGGEKYTTVQSAIDACSIEAGETKTTINLLKDISIGRTMTIKEGQNITIDSCENDVYAYANPCILNEGNVEIKNTKQFEYENTYNSLVNNGTYYFENQDGKWVNTNKGVHNSVANSYVEIDLSDLVGEYGLTVNAEISSESADYGYATITASTDAPLYSDATNRFIYISGTVAAKEYTYTLEGGKRYYLHFGYRKDRSGNTGSDCFSINSIKIEKKVLGKFISYGQIIIENKGTATISDEYSKFMYYGNGISNAYKSAISNKGTLNINGGLINTTKNYVNAINNYESGILNITGGTITTSGQYGYGVYNNGAGTINITGGVLNVSYNSHDSVYGIFNNNIGTVNITGGTITVNNSSRSYYAYGIYNNNAGIINISGIANIYSSGYGLYNYSTGTINISGGTVKGASRDGIYNSSTGIINITEGTVTSTSSTGVYNNSTGTINITGGTVKSTSSSGVYNNSTGTITVGEKMTEEELENGETPSTVSPIIKGATYGVYNDSGTFYFYDGAITGAEGKSMYGIIDKKETDYQVVKNINEETGLETAMLQKAYIAEIVDASGETIIGQYEAITKLQEAINGLSSTEEYTIKILNELYMCSGEDLVIPENITITLDLNGYSIIACNKITNNGNLEIIDSSEDKTSKITESSEIFIQNTGNLIINGGKYYAHRKNSKIIYNTENGTINWKAGQAYLNSKTEGKYQYIIYTEGTGDINWENGNVYLTANYAKIYQYAIYTKGTGTINIENVNLECTGYEWTYSGYSYQYLIYTNNPSGEKNIINIKNIDGNKTSTNGRKYIVAGKNAIVNVSGGKFYNLTNSINGNMEINITGGEILSNIYSEGKLNVEDGTISSITTYGNAVINKGTISSVESYGSTVINDGTIGKIKSYNSNSNVIINNGTIYNSSENAVEISGGRLTLLGGTVESSKGYGIYIYNSGIFILGSNDEEAPKVTPPVTGSTYGVYNNGGTFNFYDGTITGQTKAIYGSVTNVPDQYKVSYSEDEKIATLDIIATAESIVSVGGIYYDTLQAAITAAVQSTEPVEVYKDIELTSSVIIAEGQTVTLNLNANSITYTGINGAIINNGTLTITDIVDEEDSTEKTTSIIQNTSGPAITNNGTLTIGVDDGNVDTITPNIIGTPDAIENMGTLNLYDGLLNGEPVTVGTTTANITVYSLAKQTLLNTQNNAQEGTTGGETVNYMSVPTIKATPTLPTWTNDNVEVIIENSNRLILNVNNPQKGFDLALRKYITQINGQDVAESRTPEISEFTAQGILETNTGYYRHTKQALSVNKDDIVVYNISIYNEGTISGYASEIVDYLPSGLELIPDNEINIANGWQIASTDETGKATAIKTNILANRLIQASENTNTITNMLSGSLSEAPYLQVVCKVVQEPSADKVYLTSRAEITAHKDENGNMYGKYFEEQEAENTDIDSTPNTIENNLNLSTWYAENVENFIPKIENYYEGVQDDDDFETVYIEEKTSVEGTKTWENTRYNENNLTVTIELYKDGIATGKTVETTKSKNWKYEFTNLSKYDREREIVYTVKEVKVMNGTEDVTNKFTVSYNGNNIKNTERVDIPVAKKWNVDNPEKYKAVFTLKKTVNGVTEIAQELVDGNYVDATRAITGNGTATFENFEKYENGVKITYSVEETLIQVAENSSQSIEYSGQETENNNQVNENSGQTWSDIPIENFIITNENGTTVNTLKKEVSKNKEWRRIENPDDYRATFKLYKLVGEDENSTQRLEPVNDKEPVILTGNGTVKFSDLPAYEGTTEITYKIVEELAEYKSSVTSQWVTLTKDYDYTETEEEGTIINTILEKKTAIGEKRWPNVPNSNLYKTTLGLYKVVDGEDLEVVDQSGVHKTQQIVGNGKITFTNLLKYNSENEEIEYKVKEIPNTAYYRLSEDSEEWIKLENYYTTITEEGIIENIVTTKAIKNKEWADVQNSNLYKATFGLYKVVNGQDVEVKDESNNQLTKAVIGNGTATFTNLQKYENGSEIQYKIKEIEAYYRLTEDDETWTKLEKTNYYVTDEGDTIVNKVIKQISITKTWNGVGNPDLYRATVVVNKIVDGTPVTATDITGAEITEQYIVGNNTVIFKNLPKYENGNEIRYEVEETNVKFRFTKLSLFVDMDLADFEVLVNEDGSIVNTRRTIETTQITKNKIWRVSDDVNNYRATFKLYKNINGEDIAVTEDADGSPIEEKTVIGNGQVEFANLVRYDENNKEIQYKIKETKIEKSGEQLNLTDFIITEQGNTIVNTEKTALEGTKEWEVQKYEEDKLTIKVELYKNGTATGNVKTVTLADNIKTETAVSTENTKAATTVTSTENWTYSFTDLPAYDENGAKITYTIKEKQVIYNNEDVTNKFTVTYNGNNIKNTENLDIPVTKEWIGVKNAQLYKSTVILDKTVNGATKIATYADESEVTEKTIIGNETVTFENLPKYEDGKLIIYTPREISVSSRADEQSDFNETVSLENFEITVQDGKITNKLIELSGTKTWELSKYEEQNLKVIIRLYKNGEATDKKQILTEETGWNYSFKELAVREGDVTNTYTVKEETVLYTNGTEDIDIINNFVIEYAGNNIKNIENVDCLIQKEWVGVEEALSYRAEFTLYKTADGVESEVKGEDGNNITKVITGNNTDSFNNLPKYENGKEITYTAKETKIETTASTGDWIEFTSDKDWFETSVTKEKIVNRLLTKILVKEEWQNVEEENLHNYKVKLTLYRKLESGLQIAKDKNGNNVLSKEIIGNGTAEFTDLPKYENGERIVYVLKEEHASVNNGTEWDILNNNLYTIKYSTIEGIIGTDGEIKVVNTVEQTEQSVEKVWSDNNNQDGIRPEEIEVQLNANGSKYEVEGVINPVILNKENNWLYTWENLPKKANGVDIEYKVVEITSIEGYTANSKEDNLEKIAKVDLKHSDLSEVVVKFRYSIRVTNEGKIAGTADEISDYIPSGLKFDKADNPEWIIADEKVTTDALKEKVLQPGESAKVSIVLTWINSSSNMGIMVNTAEISKDSNEYGASDIDSIPNNKQSEEDDIDDTLVMVTVKTGTEVIVYMVLSLGGFAVVGLGIFVIKKKVLK